MGKKSSNPVDSFRKAQKARELRKNKDARKKVREDQAVKRDTRDIEGEIRRLKNSKLNDEGEERLRALETELKHVVKAKEKYVAAHPGERDRIFHTGKYQHRERRGGDGDGDGDEGEGTGPSASGTSRDMSHLYKPDGTLRDPKRSAYYDPVYNPFGVPPPGMPYRERSGALSESESSSSDSDSDDDSDIVMPEGPRPDSDSGSGSESDDSDIPLPDGPPPPRAPPPPPLPAGFGPGPGGFPPGFAPGFGPGAPGFGPGFARPPPMPMRPPQHAGWGHLMPPAPPRPVRPPRPAAGLPARPGSSLPAPPASLPPRPQAGPGPGPAAIAAAPTARQPAAPTTTPAAPAPVPVSATISAEPQLRDLRKEATMFVPRGLRRKKGSVAVNATPGAGQVDADGDSVRVRAAPGPSLMGKLQGVLGDGNGKVQEKAKAEEDEYERFLEGLE